MKNTLKSIGIIALAAVIIFSMASCPDGGKGEGITYTVTYDGNGNDSGVAPTDYGSPYTRGATVWILRSANSFGKTGHTFADWNTAINGSGAAYSADMSFTINGNTTLYAQWTPTPHTHQWGNWIQTKAPTETEEGEETRTCTLNPVHKETRPIAVLTHTHQWGNWVQTKAPSEMEEGVETRTCATNPAHTETRPVARIPIINDNHLNTVLGLLPANTPGTRHTLVVNMDSTWYLRGGLLANPTKYVYLDCTGSTFTYISSTAFNRGDSGNYAGCTTLIGITLPNSVTEFDVSGFYNCSNFASITFQRTIPSSNFSNSTSIGDLRAKFYAADPSNGTPGTYTTANPGYGAVWTRQP